MNICSRLWSKITAYCSATESANWFKSGIGLPGQNSFDANASERARFWTPLLLKWHRGNKTAKAKKPLCFGKVGILFCVSPLLAGCGPSMFDLQQMTPHQRANTACSYSATWQEAKKNRDYAHEQYSIWETNATNGYETKRQCQYVQEPYSDTERVCYGSYYYNDCDRVTVTKYRSVRRCTNVYVPINVDAAYKNADYWKDRRSEYTSAMTRAWNSCYSWAVKATPQQIHHWLNN